MAEPAAIDHRRGPRRRGDRLLDAVFEAVLAELTERGYAALTVEAVAARARVGKASLYRRWPGKRELVMAAVRAGVPEPEHLVDAASLRADLLAYFGEVAAYLRSPAGPALRAVLAEAGAPGLDRGAVRRRSTDRLRELAERAVVRGELSAARVRTVTPRQWEAGPAVLRHHFLWDDEVGDALCVQIVDEVVLPLLRGHEEEP